MSIINAQAFKIIEGRPVTSSRIVAEYFGKRHNDVLRGIRDSSKRTRISPSLSLHEKNRSRPVMAHRDLIQCS